LSRGDTFVHRIHPLTLLTVTISYIVILVSLDNHNLSLLIPYLLYPALFMVLAEIPAGYLFRILLPVLPLAVMLGAAHPFFDKVPVEVFSGIFIGRGWISAFVLFLRFILTVSAALLFMATAGMEGLIKALTALKVSEYFLSVLSFTYRYVHLLMHEAGSLFSAYRLRSPGSRGVALSDWGPLGGQWLIRSFRRAGRIHKAMNCRGWSYAPRTARPCNRGCSESITMGSTGKIYSGGILWLVIWLAYFIICKYFTLQDMFL